MGIENVKNNGQVPRQETPARIYTKAEIDQYITDIKNGNDNRKTKLENIYKKAHKEIKNYIQEQNKEYKLGLELDDTEKKDTGIKAEDNNAKNTGSTLEGLEKNLEQKTKATADGKDTGNKELNKVRDKALEIINKIEPAEKREKVKNLWKKLVTDVNYSLDNFLQDVKKLNLPKNVIDDLMPQVKNTLELLGRVKIKIIEESKLSDKDKMALLKDLKAQAERKGYYTGTFAALLNEKIETLSAKIAADSAAELAAQRKADELAKTQIGLSTKKETVYDAAQKILNDEKELKESLQANLKEIENIINDFLKKVKETNKEWIKALADKLEKYVDDTRSESLQKFAKQIITMRVAAYLNEQAGNTKLTAARKEQEIKKIIAQTTREIKTMLKKELDEVNTAKLSQPVKEKLIEEKTANLKSDLYKENIKELKNIWTEKVKELKKELAGKLENMSFEKKNLLTEQIKALQGQITEMQDIINAMNITKNFDANKALEDLKTKQEAFKKEIGQLNTIVHKKPVNAREESIKRKLAGIADRLSDEFKYWQTEKGKEELKEKINEIIKMAENISSIENIEALEGMLQKLGDLSLLPENIKALIEELKEEVKLLENAAALAENGSLSEETKEALLGKIKTPALVEKAQALDASNLESRFSATA